ncbi:hypothetical protein [Croceimicrobium sp.]|uniref:hypothetical protein n=1 Tax=Croceimicrobium sp. TaxID=2828340 RepID=UPI003BA9FE40
MDREGFELVDAAFQQDLFRESQPIKEKWEAHYRKKNYDGLSNEEKARAKAQDQEQKTHKIKSEIAPIREKLSFAHFPDIGREAALEKVEKEEQRQEVLDRIRGKLKEKTNEKFKGKER